ncbi:probable ATP-dependent RNA helicase DDX49 isoform X2 [Rattus norvegicus]|uniref:probable ATP-dependent RNA helicase DDX49 isoform X2 n=1 Tax=Rattus norvegicus TaxID=10116 RepID=UPI002FD7D50D
MAGFAELRLSSWLVEQCRQLGLKQPTPVQLGCIPAILEGRDCLGCAKTGSGKTAAFVLPILQKLSEDPYGIFCLVLTPTRELAYQIAEQFRVLGKPLGLKDCIIVGGMDMVTQALELSRKPHVVIATPGRLADHLRSSNTFNMKKIRFLVLDEADRLLEQGCTDFTADLETILSAVPARRQTLLFSATLTDTLKELQGLATNQPFFWEAQATVRTVEQLDQRYLLVPEKVKDAYLVHLVQTFQDQLEDCSIIIFTNTCKTCQILCMMLRKFNFPTVALHSMMKQAHSMCSQTSPCLWHRKSALQPWPDSSPAPIGFLLLLTWPPEAWTSPLCRWSSTTTPLGSPRSTSIGSVAQPVQGGRDRPSHW